MRFAIVRFGLRILAGLGVCCAGARAADATSPIDYTQRNLPLAPDRAIDAPKSAPVINENVQQRRVNPDTVERKVAPVGAKRAAFDVKETTEKNVRGKDSERPAVVDQAKSRYDQQRARVSTNGDATKPPTVAKYQDSLTAASASNMARFPAISGATNAKINRFVFRKNGGELADTAQRASVTPAAGGSIPK